MDARILDLSFKKTSAAIAVIFGMAQYRGEFRKLETGECRFQIESPLALPRIDIGLPGNALSAAPSGALVQ